MLSQLPWSVPLERRAMDKGYLRLSFSLFSFCHKTGLYHTSPK